MCVYILYVAVSQHAWPVTYVLLFRESFQESLGIDFKKFGALVEPKVELELQAT